MSAQATQAGEAANTDAPVEAGAEAIGPSGLDLFQDYIGVFAVAFLVTVCVTPIMRRLAVSHGIIDRPGEARKVHRVPIAYLGGVAVYLGLMAAVLFSYTEQWHGLISYHDSDHQDVGLFPGGVPISIVGGMTVIMLIGLWDDVVGIDPRAKIAGQLMAAAFLAMNDVGVKVAEGFMYPAAHALGIETLVFEIPMPGGGIVPVDIVYWTGTAIIAVFIIGGCNASNLIDGLDGLLSGVTAIAAAGILVIALGLAVMDDGPMDAARIVFAMAVAGACLGFLPHNFNPATIFLGDCGSMLLGYCTVVLILTLGDTAPGNTGRTHLVVAGLIIYAIPIIDTTLAIFRRKLAGKSISDADDQHLHHMLKRALGVKGAVLALYGIGIAFASFAVVLSAGRVRLMYTMALVFAAFITVTSFKIARRDLIAAQARARDERLGLAGPTQGDAPDALEEPSSPAAGGENGTPTGEPESPNPAG